MRIPYISALAAGALALGGCAYGDLGMGLGYGGGYGGGYGYNSPYYGGGYGYSPYGYGAGYSPYGYGSASYGWYDNYYYPGTGYYVYDNNRRPYAMSTTQRQYWTTRAPRTNTTTRVNVRPNWSGFTRTSADRQDRRDARQDRRDDRRR